MTLGENIQTARKAKGLSQEALAEQVGVSRQALGKWEKDTALPSLDNLQALAAVLDVSVDVLLGTTQADGTPEPALTLETLRTLLEARDAQKRRGMQPWGQRHCCCVCWWGWPGSMTGRWMPCSRTIR